MVYRVALASGKEVIVKETDNGAGRPLGAQVGLDWSPTDVVILEE